MPVGRLVAEGFLAHLWVWLVCTGFALLNLYCVSEAVDRNASLEGSSGIHFWHFIGLPVFSIVFCGILVKPVIMYLQCRIDGSSMRADALCSSLKASFVLCQGVIYILFCTIGFFAPFTDFRQVELAERHLRNASSRVGVHQLHDGQEPREHRCPHGPLLVLCSRGPSVERCV